MHFSKFLHYKLQNCTSVWVHFLYLFLPKIPPFLQINLHMSKKSCIFARTFVKHSSTKAY